jgi:hypothetical protein
MVGGLLVRLQSISPDEWWIVLEGKEKRIKKRDSRARGYGFQYCLPSRWHHTIGKQPLKRPSKTHFLFKRTFFLGSPGTVFPCSQVDTLPS